MVKVKRLGVLSFAKINGIIGVFIGLVAGVFMWLFSLTFNAAMASGMEGLDATTMGFARLGAASIILFPIIYGVMGFLGGAIMAWPYNTVARWMGGIEIDLEQ